MADDRKPQVQLAVSNDASEPSKAGAEKASAESGKPGATKQASAKPSSAKSGSRPSVVSLNYPDKKSLQKAYMSFLKGGGLFLPTSSSHDMNDEIFLLVTLPESAKPIPVPGTVVWKTPTGAVDGKQQGVGIEFKGREGNSLRNRIEGLIGAKVTSSTPTHTM